MNVTLTVLTMQTRSCKHVSIEAVVSPKTGIIIVFIYNRLKDFFAVIFLDQHNLQDLRISNSYLVHLLWYRNRQLVFFAQKHDDSSNNLF